MNLIYNTISYNTITALLIRLFCLLLFYSCAKKTPRKPNANTNLKLLTTQTKFTAGDAITLDFTESKDTTLQLYCTNSYGATLLKPTYKQNVLSYTIPKHISHKTGVTNWILANNTNPITGHFTIAPKPEPVSMETFIGPPSIDAGNKDFTMLVVIPTDHLDNPLSDSTKVTVQHQFLSKEDQKTITIKDLIAYNNIYSPLKSGRLLISSECLDLNSKEYSVNVMPSIPLNFTIAAERYHDYADGNQITTLTTSILKDKNANTISDGSYVDFYITNKDGNVLKTSGTTINGIANAKIVHPDYAETWTIKAYVDGIAESNTISLSYNQVITDFNCVFSKQNRHLKIGPLHSFMGQMIPDGLIVNLVVYKDGHKITELIKDSKSGYAIFNLDEAILPANNYDIEITTAKITKIFKSVAL